MSNEVGVDLGGFTKRERREIGVFNAIAGSSDDGPVLMLNLNRYVRRGQLSGWRTLP